MQITRTHATYPQTDIKTRKTDEKENANEEVKEDSKVNEGFDFNAMFDKKVQDKNLERLQNLKLFSHVNIIDAQVRSARMIDRMATSMLSLLDDTSDIADLFIGITNTIPGYEINPDKKPPVVDKEKDKDQDKVNEEEKVDETENNDKTDETDNIGETEETPEDNK